jgi:DNA-binding MarR family transcriptional regulator
MEDNLHIEELLVFLILRTSRVIIDRVRDQSVVAASGFTVVHGAALSYIARHESPTSADLASHLKVTKQSASQLVASLEDAGIVRRVPHPTDGRARVLIITEEGQKLYAEGRREMSVIEEEWVEILGARQLGAVRKALTTYLNATTKPTTTS